MRVVESQWWIIDLPDEWEADQEEDSIIISDEDGVGEIVFTTMEKQQGDVTDADLKLHTEDLQQQFGAGQALNIAELEGYYYSYQEDDDAVREWYLRCDKLLLLITYSCDQDNAGMDDAAVDEILSTLYIKVEGDNDE